MPRRLKTRPWGALVDLSERRIMLYDAVGRGAAVSIELERLHNCVVAELPEADVQINRGGEYVHVVGGPDRDALLNAFIAAAKAGGYVLC